MDPPVPPTRGARYDEHHLRQVWTVTQLSEEKGISRTAACELIAAERLAINQPSPSRTRAKTVATLCFAGRVRRIADGAYLVCDKRLSRGELLLVDNAIRSIQRELLARRTAIARLREPLPASKVHRIR